eukprot:CAMPEP_0167745186 /NCGR_PEP_ID=MMETSP0110_2-20121227/3012_1 /TAXON_ID=629695 /ORGANISM="Gymnochlora sp., Strain CCMP2014" /LENGTH=607 /DNA_ID=CAMNT_0007629801 /DNA_START=1360 /DNA_END=3183 /DNA_ORIENTATION=-
MANFFLCDIKGWIPRSVIEMTIGSTLQKFYTSVLPDALKKYNFLTPEQDTTYLLDHIPDLRKTIIPPPDSKIREIRESKEQSIEAVAKLIPNSVEKPVCKPLPPEADEWIRIGKAANAKLIKEFEKDKSHWRQRNSSSNPRVISGMIAPIPYSAFFADATVPGSCERTVHILHNCPYNQDWNPNYNKYQKLMTLAPGIDLAYILTNPIGPISPRDQVWVRCAVRYRGGYVVSLTSVNWKKIGPVSGVVRAETPLGEGIVVFPDGKNKCKMANFFLCDIKGWIPRSVIEMTIGSTLQKFYTAVLPNALKKYDFLTPEKDRAYLLKHIPGSGEMNTPAIDQKSDMKMIHELEGASKDREEKKGISTKLYKKLPIHELTSSQHKKWASIALDSMEKLIYKIESTEIDWKTVKTMNQIEVSSGMVPDISYKVFRGEGVIHTSPEKLYQMIFDAKFTEKHNPNYQYFKVEETLLKGYLEIVYVRTNPIGPVSPRDNIKVRYWRRYKGGYVVTAPSILWNKYPQAKGFVRAYDPPGGGFAILPIEGKKGFCKMINFMGTDVKGWIPRIVLDMTIGTEIFKFYNETIPHFLRTHGRDITAESAREYTENYFRTS